MQRRDASQKQKCIYQSLIPWNKPKASGKDTDLPRDQRKIPPRHRTTKIG